MNFLNFNQQDFEALKSLQALLKTLEGRLASQITKAHETKLNSKKENKTFRQKLDWYERYLIALNFNINDPIFINFMHENFGKIMLNKSTLYTLMRYIAPIFIVLEEIKDIDCRLKEDVEKLRNFYIKHGFTHLNHTKDFPIKPSGYWET